MRSQEKGSAQLIRRRIGRRRRPHAQGRPDRLRGPGVSRRVLREAALRPGRAGRPARGPPGRNPGLRDGLLGAEVQAKMIFAAFLFV